MLNFARARWAVALVVCFLLAAVGSGFIVEHYEPTKRQAEQEAQNQSEAKALDILASERVAYYTKVLAIFTGVLSVFGLMQIVFVFRSDRTARMAALAAQKSADALPAIERSYVFVRITSSNMRLRDANIQGVQTSPARSLSVQYTFVNHGKTPAVIREIRVGIRRLRGQVPVDAWANEPLTDSPMDVLAPGDAMLVSGHSPLVARDPEPMTEAAAAQIEARTVQVYFFGHLIYEDVFGAKRETQFCYQAIRTGGRLEQWGGPAYNYRT